MKSEIDYSLYLCTDRSLMSSETIQEAVELSIQGGCTIIQLREKECTSREFYEIAKNVKTITDRYKIPLIINDRIDIALAVDADGVHIGQSDLPADTVRKILGEKKILGVSVSTAEEALTAKKDGANYLGVGAMYSTGTKPDAESVSLNELKNIRNNVDIPIVVIGGINKNTIINFKDCNIDGAAVVSAIISQDDIKAAAKELHTIFKKMKSEEV